MGLPCGVNTGPFYREESSDCSFLFSEADEQHFSALKTPCALSHMYPVSAKMQPEKSPCLLSKSLNPYENCLIRHRLFPRSARRLSSGSSSRSMWRSCRHPLCLPDMLACLWYPGGSSLVKTYIFAIASLGRHYPPAPESGGGFSIRPLCWVDKRTPHLLLALPM